ncbi:DNA-binding MarR family transcriptional regulator [Dyadobacter jejuensis]|uniref:DNA-binding MarR family transcriptional regulator n=1 Tax=Dyadobacter jejuensis TaxID=1082580 RepID=A0A316AH08_9BACT|nr:MarR family transcriptional regulator [Dyadobacter jejuensis]PWJ56548.1 DNA-binding MarR family transcriptional regulator [Dyadobacter jejuensis]
MRKEKTVDFQIKWAWHSISRMYNTYATQYDITMAVGYVLLNIDVENGTPATKIAPMLGMEPRSLVRMLSNLEKRGLISRELDPTDRRFVRIMLTEAGKEKREISKQGVIDFNNMIREKIPLDKLATFFDVMTEINKIVDEENIRIKAGDLSDSID